MINTSPKMEVSFKEDMDWSSSSKVGVRRSERLTLVPFIRDSRILEMVCFMAWMGLLLICTAKRHGWQKISRLTTCLHYITT